MADWLDRAVDDARHDDRLTIGQMAELNCTTIKTLRLYHSSGLLEPSHVDKETGYRYYTIEQSLKLDQILHLQTLGFSLDEIKHLIKGVDPLVKLKIYERQLEKLQVEMLGLKAACNDLRFALKHGCSEDVTAGKVGRIELAWQSMKCFLTTAVPSHEYAEHFNEESARYWYRTMREVKRGMREQGVPLTFFRDVGILFPLENALQGHVVIDTVVVPCDEETASYYPNSCIMPSGFYLVSWVQSFEDGRGRSTERDTVLRLLQYAEEQGMVPVGGILSEGDVSSPITFGNERNKPSKIQVRVTF